MPADNDLDRAGGTLAQHRVHIVQGHAVHHRVIDLHDLIPTPGGVERGVGMMMMMAVVVMAGRWVQTFGLFIHVR